MKISISEARKQLPSLVRQIQSNSLSCIQITLHGAVVAELRPPVAAPGPRAATKQLLKLMEQVESPAPVKRLLPDV